VGAHLGIPARRCTQRDRCALGSERQFNAAIDGPTLFEISRGTPPDAALRDAKLSLILLAPRIASRSTGHRFKSIAALDGLKRTLQLSERHCNRAAGSADRRWNPTNQSHQQRENNPDPEKQWRNPKSKGQMKRKSAS